MNSYILLWSGFMATLVTTVNGGCGPSKERPYKKLNADTLTTRLAQMTDNNDRADTALLRRKFFQSDHLALIFSNQNEYATVNDSEATSNQLKSLRSPGV